MDIGRDKNGRFTKGNKEGKSPGRKRMPPDYKKACEELTLPALEVLKEILLDKGQPANARLKAAEMILDRAYGKPAQAVQVEAVDTTVRIIDEDPEGADFNG